MTVRGFKTAEGRLVKHGDLLGLRTAVDLFDVRLDELREVHEATFPVAFGR